MIQEAAITLCCTLFIAMGLSEAVQDAVGIRLRPLSCPKCMTFWCVLAYGLMCRGGIIQSVLTAFLCSYSALWLTLLIDGLAVLYNRLYEKINNADTSPQAREDHPQAGEVSKM